MDILTTHLARERLKRNLRPMLTPLLRRILMLMHITGTFTTASDLLVMVMDTFRMVLDTPTDTMDILM